MLGYIATFWEDVTPVFRILLVLAGLGTGIASAWIGWGACGERLKPLRKERAKLKSKIRRLRKDLENAPVSPPTEAPISSKSESPATTNPERDEDMITLEVSLENANQPLAAPQQVSLENTNPPPAAPQQQSPLTTQAAPTPEPLPRPTRLINAQPKLADAEAEAFETLRSTVRVERLRDLTPAKRKKSRSIKRDKE